MLLPPPVVPLGQAVRRSGAQPFFSAAMFTQTFDNVMLPPKTHVLGTPNRDGQVAY